MTHRYLTFLLRALMDWADDSKIDFEKVYEDARRLHGEAA